VIKPYAAQQFDLLYFVYRSPPTHHEKNSWYATICTISTGFDPIVWRPTILQIV